MTKKGTFRSKRALAFLKESAENFGVLKVSLEKSGVAWMILIWRLHPAPWRII